MSPKDEMGELRGIESRRATMEGSLGSNIHGSKVLRVHIKEMDLHLCLWLLES